MNIKKISIGLMFLILALVIVPGASAYFGFLAAHPTSNPTPEVCGGCHPANGVSCTTCHTNPFTLTINANPTTVTAGTPSSVTFTVTRKNSAQAVSAATVDLTGVATGSGTTSSVGTAAISVTATAGSITATASKTGYTSGTTTLIANAALDTTPPVITLLGLTPIDIVVGSVYVDAGATALDNKDGDLTAAIVTVNSVNTAVIGIYTVTYNVADTAGNNAVEKVRTVNVVASASDTTPPVITLLGLTPIDIVVGSVYVDAGATALDNVDGDLTAAIVTVNSVNTAVIGTYTVTYNVADAAGNKAVEVVRTVNVVAAGPDTTPPVITLLGSTPVSIVVGSVYVDAGATAIDNKDGDLTAAIVTVNSVNIAVIGSHTVTYNVVDAAGNNAVEKVRTVNVEADITPPPPVPELPTMLLTSAGIIGLLLMWRKKMV